MRDHPANVAPDDLTTYDIWVVLTEDERESVRQMLMPDDICKVLTKDEQERVAEQAGRLTDAGSDQ